MLESKRPDASARLYAHTPTCCCACPRTSHSMPAFAARSAHAAAAPARLLRPERDADAALARVLHALHLLLLRLHGESMCVWPIEMHTREGESTTRILMLIPVACFTMGDQA
jgi:hypothetical protein